MARRPTNPNNPSADGADGAPAGSVPYSLVMAAAYSWRIIVVGVVVLAMFSAFATLSQVGLPLIIALLIAAPLERVVAFLSKLGLPRGLAAALTVLGLVVTVFALIAIAGTSIVSGFGELRDAALRGFKDLVSWLVDGPLHVAQGTLDSLQNSLSAFLRDHTLGIASGALSVTGTIGALFAGSVIALLALFFFLRDGRGMWTWGVRHVPGVDAERVDRAGVNAWITLRRYTQTSAFVAFVDAVGIGTGAWILGLPLAFPIAITVFLFSFIPLFGATISGAIAVLVALVDGGWVTALIMLGVVVVVQQLEGSILYPWLFGKAASIHPMVILVTVASGTLLAGLVGAVVAVPLVAFAIAFGNGMRKEFTGPEQPPITVQLPALRERSKQLFRRGVHRSHAVDPAASADDVDAPAKAEAPVTEP